MAAPLIAGNDLRNMTQSTIEVFTELMIALSTLLTQKKILTAPEVIAVDQDPLGKQGRRVYMQYIN